MNQIALAIHGGCGVLPLAELSEQEWQAARLDLARAVAKGFGILKQNGSALDAVEAAVIVLEDSPYFNAGHGAALNENGVHELDASIMSGRDLDAGAVTLVRHIKNPIRAARLVMEKADAVLLGGEAADAFARKHGLDCVEQSYFTTQKRQQALISMQNRVKLGTSAIASEAEKHGTVGAVALDAQGHLAAATSTGGYTNKPAGRIGDSPIIGAGTYARDGVCAVSGTGKGEYFIRHAVGHEIASRMAYAGQTLQAASDDLIHNVMQAQNIGAGLVAVGADGAVHAPYNTPGMFRGWVGVDGVIHVASHAEIFIHNADAL